ncbi:MAG: ROK family protein [Elusimicrobia bacterium]|nr:ROK family protein [Elusimicrobiota bacterium]
MAMENNRFIGVGIDVGGTYTKLAAISDAGIVFAQSTVETLPGLGPMKFLDRLEAAVRLLKDSISRPVRAMGMGLAGDVDSRKGMLRCSPNMEPFTGFPFKRRLESRFQVPVSIENDATLAAWGGYVAELKRRPRNVVCLTLGTGIGGGVVVEGALYRGSTGTAGEIGHTIVEPDGEECSCGARGCLEAYAGSYGIVRTAKKFLAHREGLAAGSGRRRVVGSRNIVWRLCPDLSRLDARVLALAAQRGDWAARKTWGVAGYYLGIGIANAVMLFNPDVVLLTGGVSRAGRWFMGPLLRVVRTRPMGIPARHVRVRIAKTPNLGSLGAAAWALEERKIS